MASSIPDRDLPFYAGDLYGELTLKEPDAARPSPSVRAHVPGLLLAGVAALAAAWLSDHYGIPIVLMGLLLGLALNSAANDAKLHPGLEFASYRGLRIGVVLLGFQITFAKIAELGAVAFAALIAIMAISFAAGILGARLAGQSRYAGILAGGATAICGASAALALVAVIGHERVSRAQFTLTLVAVALASGLAMAIYPVLAVQIGLNNQAAGFLVGASVHDVAQAIGGGYSISNEAGEAATIVKLARVALLAPVVFLISLWIGGAARTGAGAKSRRLPAVPWFIAAFLALAALSSVLPMPAPIISASSTAAKALLLLAVTSAAMQTRLDLVRSLGWRAVVPVICASLASMAAALAFAAFGSA